VPLSAARVPNGTTPWPTDSPVKDPDRLDRADQFWVLALEGFLLALLAAAVVFIVWLWRTRVTLNSSAMDSTGAVGAG
jgi:hypothetical protein